MWIYWEVRDGVYYRQSITITITLPSITITITFQIFKSITITIDLQSITSITFYYISCDWYKKELNLKEINFCFCTCND